MDYIADDGIMRSQNSLSGDIGRNKPLSFVMLIAGLGAGSHTFNLRWKVSSGNTVRMDIVDLHPQFWAKEI